MNGTIAALLLVILGLMLALGFVRGRAAIGQRAIARRLWFDACLPLFTDPKLGATDHGFARLNGYYRGRLFDLQALPDTLTFRKLPSLWLLVSLPEPMPITGRLDIMVRPTDSTVFSRFATLPAAIETPPGFPPDTAIRTDKADLALDPALTARLQSAFFSTRVKELVLSPQGLRLVWLAEEADRGRYLLYRDAEMGMRPLAPVTLAPLLDRLADLADALTAKDEP